jgi:hypothetical protein
MIKPVAWMLVLNLPNFNSSQILFLTFSEAINYKNEQELLYRRIKYSDPIALYTGSIPEGYSLVRSENRKSFINYASEKINKFFKCIN